MVCLESYHGILFRFRPGLFNTFISHFLLHKPIALEPKVNIKYIFFEFPVGEQTSRYRSIKYSRYSYYLCFYLLLFYPSLNID